MNATDKLICKVCKIEKRASQFFRDRTTKTGYSERCMACNKKIRLENPKPSEDSIRELREKNNTTIIEKRNKDLDWDRFKIIVRMVPPNLSRNQTKAQLQPIDRLKFEVRDKGRCYICGSTYYYGSSNRYISSFRDYKMSHLHHIIPNGGVNDENIITLCTHCHQMVHQALFIEGLWQYARPL